MTSSHLINMPFQLPVPLVSNEIVTFFQRDQLVIMNGASLNVSSTLRPAPTGTARPADTLSVPLHPTWIQVRHVPTKGVTRQYDRL